MTPMTMCLIIFAQMIIGFVSGKISMPTCMLSAMVLLTVTGCMKPNDAIAFFGNANVIMIAGMSVIAAGFNRTSFCTLQDPPYVDPEQILLLGHSAGGNLTATVCLRAGETGAFRPAAMVMEFCPLDLATDPATKPRAEGDMPAEVARTYNAFYCPAELAGTPYVSPIFATEEQLTAFPDTLIMSAAKDSLCFEDEEFAMKLARAGVNTTCRRFQDSLHGFTINRNGAWEASQQMLKQFVKAHLK